MPVNAPGSHATLTFQNYHDVGGTQINGGTVTLSTLLVETATKKIQLTQLFVADTRTVSLEGSRTGEGTKTGKSLVGAEGIAEESKQTQREVSANGTGDKLVNGDEVVIKEVGIYYFPEVQSVLIVCRKGNVKMVMDYLLQFFWLYRYFTKSQTVS